MEGQYRDSAVAAGRNEACIADRIKALQVPEQAPSAAVLMSIPLPPAGYDGALQNLCAYQVWQERTQQGRDWQLLCRFLGEGRSTPHHYCRPRLLQLQL